MEQTRVMCNQEELVQPPRLHEWDVFGDKNGNHQAWSNRPTPEPSRGGDSTKESDMDMIRWIGVSGFLLSVLPCYRAQSCLSETNCCHNTEITQVVELLTNQVESAQAELMPSSHGCQAVSEGAQNERSTSPWIYELDSDPKRYPQRLWQARCSCLHRCVSLASCNKASGGGNQSLFSRPEPNGNSVEVKHDILVFYREPCPKKPDRFYLKPALYPVNGLCFLVFLLLTASISAYMGAALLEVLVTLAFLGLRATHYYERLTRVNWPCLDFLRCISAAIVFTVVAFAVIAASHEGSAVSAFVFSLILIAVFCFDAYKTYRAEMGSEQDPGLG
ncbi:hypothetical protein JRQ81_004411 [Phrynocephalus forsythii]|uniref:MARVEL domain-containing protein n=1 Tax=Phrynocephalus forsythii TaxID=171643 RepID=A0A9Q1AUJ5_9SAUR|nr:hypothetical protein JRQ81_004411 [Phrynocephalus forsythii]